MKFLLLPLAFVSVSAMACPGDAAKSASASTTAPAVAQSTPAATPAAAKAPGAKVALKGTEARKNTL